MSDTLKLEQPDNAASFTANGYPGRPGLGEAGVQLPGGDIQMMHGDARDLISLIPDESIDLVFTDPPYPKKYLPLYGWLGQEAKRVLKPDGFLLAYSGIYWLQQVMGMLGEQLEYWWAFALTDEGNSPICWQKKIISRYKTILAYRKGRAVPQCITLGLWNGSTGDKRFHIWGQEASSARYYIDCFSREGDTILDPFMGGGTVPAVCKKIKRNCIAMEIEEENYNVAVERVDGTNQIETFDQTDLWGEGN